ENRAKFMDECAKKSSGTMAAIMGVPEEKLDEYMKSSGGIIGPAGYNSPGQIVISGETQSVKKVIETVKASGTGKCIELKVSGAWHSGLMKEAMDKLAGELDKVKFNEPKIPVIGNLTASEHKKDSDSIKTALVKQLCSPVKWIQSVETMIDKYGVSEFIETGSGKVLTGLIKRINSGVKLTNVNSVAQYLEFC
nr:ACP S-malonyltransferase [bacterium]